MQTSWLDLGPRMRVIMAAAFFGLQLGLVLTAPWRSDGVFGFQMFNASSTLRIALFRRVRDAQGAELLLPVERGRWLAHDANGMLHEFRWRDRVRDPALAALDRTVHAKDSVDAQLFHLQRALDDAASHLAQAADQDVETLAFIARVQASDNGRVRPRVELERVVPR